MIWNSKGLVFGSVLAAQKGRDEPGGVSPPPQNKLTNIDLENFPTFMTEVGYDIGGTITL